MELRISPKITTLFAPVVVKWLSEQTPHPVNPVGTCQVQSRPPRQRRNQENENLGIIIEAIDHRHSVGLLGSSVELQKCIACRTRSESLSHYLIRI